MLERRLDNVIYRMGFGTSRAQARQMVRHGHIEVNGRKVDIPSYIVRPNDVVEVREKSRTKPGHPSAPRRHRPRSCSELAGSRPRGAEGTDPRPSRSATSWCRSSSNEQLIVELYSK